MAAGIYWLIRNEVKPGARLAEAACGENRALEKEKASLCAACEFAGLQTIRERARQAWNLTNEQHLAVAYPAGRQLP